MSLSLMIITLFLIVREPLKHINMERICPKFVFTCTHDTAIELRMLLLIDNHLREHKWWKNAQSDYFSVVFVFFLFLFFHVYLIRGISQSIWIGISRRLDQKSSVNLCLLTFYPKATCFQIHSSFILCVAWCWQEVFVCNM